MKKKLVLSFVLQFFSLLMIGQGGSSFKEKEIPKSNTQYIDPTIGNVGHLLQPTRPTVQVPHQMIRMYPVRADYISDQISSFPLNIVSHRLGEVFSVKPTLNLTGVDSWSKQMTFDHDLEITRPWYFSTYLIDDEIKVEFTPGAKTGFYRFTFPSQKNKSILFGNYNRKSAQYKFSGGQELTGVETYHDDIKVYLYGFF